MSAAGWSGVSGIVKAANREGVPPRSLRAMGGVAFNRWRINDPEWLSDRTT